MTLKDKNQTHQPPEGYQLVAFTPEGSYLRAEYEQGVWEPETTYVKGKNVIVVYLTDLGREIARTERQELFPVVPKPSIPTGRWYRFCNGWLLVLEGIKEMTKCLKS